jgi:hypothetical protein
MKTALIMHGIRRYVRQDIRSPAIYGMPGNYPTLFVQWKVEKQTS